MRDIQFAPAECEAVRIDIQHRDGGAGFDGELDDRETNGSGANYQDVLAGLDLRAIDGVASDPERFDERQLIERKSCGFVELARGDDKLLAHPAVGLDTQHLEGRAAVWLAAPAGDALAAIDVRLDGAAVARSHVCDRGADGQHLDPQLMAEDAGVGKKRLLAVERVDVGAADADPPHADERLVRTGFWRRLGGDAGQAAWFFETNGDHAPSFS